MAFQSYPVNPDLSFESFLITTTADQQAVFGTTYNQNELTPINYQKIMEACLAGTLTQAPVREFTYISDPYDYTRIDNETSFNYQSINLKNALVEIYTYWKLDLLLVPPLQCPMGVVTEIRQEMSQDGTGAGLFHIVTTLKVNWLTIASKSIYA